MWHMCKYVLYIIIPLHEKKTVTTEANPTNRNSNECNLHAKWEIPRTHTSEKWHTFHHSVSVSVSAVVVSVARLCICILLAVSGLLCEYHFPPFCLFMSLHSSFACGWATGLANMRFMPLKRRRNMPNNRRSSYMPHLHATCPKWQPISQPGYKKSRGKYSRNWPPKSGRKKSNNTEMYANCFDSGFAPGSSVSVSLLKYAHYNSRFVDPDLVFDGTDFRREFQWPKARRNHRLTNAELMASHFKM